MNGEFTYFEGGIQLQGYTNKGFIMGDMIGREGKGGQAWLTYHLSADEWVQLQYMRKKQCEATSFPRPDYAKSSSRSTFVKHLPL